MNFLQHIKKYDDAVKYRCVDRATIFPDSVKNEVKSRYFDAARISSTSFERYWRAKRVAIDGPPNDTAAITDNFQYLFKKRIPPYRPGRFNSALFPTLYTAKSPETAKAERFFYLDGSTRDFEFVVYSVHVRSDIADLRPLLTSGTLTFGDDHRPCQVIAEQIRGKSNGVAWFSLRDPAGSCCAFFTCDGVTAGAIDEMAVRPVAAFPSS